MVDLLSMIIRLKKLHLVNLLSELTISAEPKILKPSIPSFKLMTSFLEIYFLHHQPENHLKNHLKLFL